MMLWIMRKLSLLAALLGCVAAFVWLSSDKYIRSTLFPPYSLHNTSVEKHGCSLAFRYLKESRENGARPVRELNRRIDFAELEPDAVVLRIAPALKPGDREAIDEEVAKKSLKPDKKDKKKKPPVLAKDKPLLTDGEAAWVRGGGRLVLALEGDYGPIETSTERRADPFERTSALWPGVQRIQPTGARTLKGAILNDALTLFTLNRGVFAAKLPMDKGEVIALASAEPFTNSHLDEADNLALLQALAPASRAIYFDEYVHELQDAPGVTELLLRWGLGAALIVMGAGALLGFWRARTPIGPPEDDHKETRTQAIDFVGSLAPLYNRALEPHQALALHYKNLLQAVTAQTGLRGAELEAKIRVLLNTNDLAAFAGQRPLTRGGFERYLSELNRGYGRLERAHRR
ncbi:MAG TPA: DUF4350 domain-containing protein [Planctomycetota bacterium]|nr:DUF4350 domain-containing protein [Planctomycetota bacterium]